MSNWREVTVLAILAAQPRFNDLENEEAIAEAQKLLDATKTHLRMDNQNTAKENTSDSPVESIDAGGTMDSTDPLSKSETPRTLVKHYPKTFPADYDQLLRGIITYNNTRQRHAKFLEYLTCEARFAFMLESGASLLRGLDDKEGVNAWARKLAAVMKDPELERTIEKNAKRVEETYKKQRYTEEEFLRVRGIFRRFATGQKQINWHIGGMMRHKESTARRFALNRRQSSDKP